jgi:tetratricopeptide (TPR) repeat protein
MMRILLLIPFLFIANISLAQSEPEVEFSKLLQEYEDGNYLNAIKLAEQCYTKDSSNSECLKILANASYALGDQANAKLFYHKLVQLDSNEIQAYVQLAAIYEQQLQIPKAIKYYTILNKKLPENPIYFRKNAHLYRSINYNNEAFLLYAQANTINPRDVVTLKGLAEICVDNDQLEMADSIIRSGLNLDEENISMYYILAKSKYKQKQYDSVTLILEGLRGRIDLNSYYNKLLGYSYLQIDSIDLAIQKLSLALVDEEESEKLHYYLASAYEKKNLLSGAMEHYEKAVLYGKSPDLDIYHRNTARIAHKEKQFKKAISHYRDAYKYSDDPLILYYLATICDTYYKDKSIAINYYNRYINSGHSDPQYLEYAKNRSSYLKEIQHQSN